VVILRRAYARAPNAAPKWMAGASVLCPFIFPRRFFKHEEKNGCSGLLFFVGAAFTNTKIPTKLQTMTTEIMRIKKWWLETTVA